MQIIMIPFLPELFQAHFVTVVNPVLSFYCIVLIIIAYNIFIILFFQIDLASLSQVYLVKGYRRF